MQSSCKDTIIMQDTKVYRIKNIYKLYKTILYVVYIRDTIIKMFKLLSKVYTILSYSGRYVTTRTHTKCSNNFKTTHCNAFKNLTATELNKKWEESFICEITNKPKRKGNKDCTCEKKCIVSQSETRIIHDGTSYKG